MVNPAAPHQQVFNPAPLHQKVVNPAQVHNRNGRDGDNTSMHSTQTQNDKTPKMVSPKICMITKNIGMRGNLQRKSKRMRSGSQSQWGRALNSDKDSLIPASQIHQQNEDIIPERETKERNNKHFLRMGQASETTAKRRSL